jgi:EAL domain-containing protein (putative c-di-GMP-specific phosphodiesterase class I)
MHEDDCLLGAERRYAFQIDMDLVRNIATTPAKQVIVAGIVSNARALDIIFLGEGIETEAELLMLKAAGIIRLQGFYFAEPMVEGLAAIHGIATREHRLSA